MKTLKEAKIIARSSDPDWVGEELFRLQGVAQQAQARVAELEAEARKEAAATHELAEAHERQGMDLAFHRHGHNAALERVAELERQLAETQAMYLAAKNEAGKIG